MLKSEFNIFNLNSWFMAATGFKPLLVKGLTTIALYPSEVAFLEGLKWMEINPFLARN